jgi:polyisoprenoid-binding protein YceI
MRVHNVSMISRVRALSTSVVAAAFFVAAALATGATRPIDAAHSTLTVFVYKSGLFSAFADNHEIAAPIASGSISEDAPLSVELTVRAASLRVLDPDLAANRREEVQTRMLGPEVLDVAKFPEITFASTAIEPAGQDRWQVSGRLTIRGRTQPIRFTVARQNDKYRGEAMVKQRDFGIEPIKIAGGTVKVKDEVTVRFEIAK